MKVLMAAVLLAFALPLSAQQLETNPVSMDAQTAGLINAAYAPLAKFPRGFCVHGIRIGDTFQVDSIQPFPEPCFNKAREADDLIGLVLYLPSLPVAVRSVMPALACAMVDAVAALEFGDIFVELYYALRFDRIRGSIALSAICLPKSEPAAGEIM